MTSTTEGRTYTIKSAVPNPNYASEIEAYRSNPFTLFNSGGVMFPDEYINVETPYTVPNGKWVLELWLNCYTWLIAPDHNKVESIELGSYHILYVSDSPFGIVKREDLGAESSHFVSAQQIHKGELGQYIPISKVNSVPEAILGPEEATNGQRQRARMGWVRLNDLVQLSGLGPTALMNGYLPFGLQGYSFEERQDAIDIVRAQWPSEIEGQQPKIETVTAEEMYELCARAVTTDIWVRRGFANTILRLITLGFALKPITA